MKFLISAVIACLLFLVDVCTYAGETFSAEHFSVEIPTGMIIDDKQEASIFLVFAGDADFERGILSVTAKKGKPTPIEAQWQKVRPLFTSNKTILFEKDEATPLLTWKTVGVSGKTGAFEIQDVAYYGVLNDTIYMLHYHCLLDRCTQIEAAFRKVLASLKPEETKGLPNTSLEPIR